MKDLIDDLLEFSRVGKEELASGGERVSTDLNSTVRESIESLAVLVNERKVEFQIGPLPTILAYPALLTQLFQNLISNGIKFQAPGQTPMIEISAVRDGPNWDIRVKDNGIGISEDYPKRIFDLFERLHHRDEYPGTGIGLAICKRIVDRHDGTLSVESEDLKGATFVISIPA